jgi:acyl carrier protein
MRATLTGTEQLRLADAGLRPLDEERALDILDQLLVASERSQAAVLALDWQQARRSPIVSQLALLRELLPTDPASSAQGLSALVEPPIAGEAAAAWAEIPVAERQQRLVDWLADQVRLALGLPPDQAIDLRRGFFQLGMDSLMAMEIQQRLQGYFGLVLPATVVFDYPYIEVLAGYLAGRIWPEEPSAGLATQSAGSATQSAGLAAIAIQETSQAQIDQLSEGEIDDLLARYA